MRKTIHTYVYSAHSFCRKIAILVTKLIRNLWQNIACNLAILSQLSRQNDFTSRTVIYRNSIRDKYVMETDKFQQTVKDSIQICLPSAPVFETFSDPAKSTKYNFPDNFFWFSKFSCFTLIRNTEWERDECSFISEKAITHQMFYSLKAKLLTRYCNMPI